MDVRLPDGTVISNVPDGITKADLSARLARNGYDVSKLGGDVPAEKPAAVSAGEAVNSIPRQFGLAARYAMEGPAQAAQIVTEPVRNLITDPLMRVLGGQKGRPLGEIASGAADWMGLPKPQTANERVIGDASRLVAGAGATMGAGSLASALPGMAGKVGAGLAAAPMQQAAAGAGAGLVSGASREAGGDPLMQAGAGIVGGILGGMAPGALSSAGNLVKRAVTPAWDNTRIDAQISQAFRARDIDYTAIPEKVKQSLRTELRSSLQAGKELNPDAVRRFADFQATGLTPTRGMLTQDPVQITREQNLAKMAANSSDDQLHGLPRLQNQNNAGMIRNMNDMGAGRADPFQAGQGAISNIRAQDQRMGEEVTGLYNQARAMPGGDTPLDRAPLVNSIYGQLAAENKMAFLPESVSSMLNTISKGEINVGGQTFPVPFDAKALDNLMTVISTAQRGTSDGNVKAALNIARRAIDAAPIGTPQTGITSPVTGAQAAAMQGAESDAGAFMGALNNARGAARSRFGWQESSRPVEAALSGAEPDKFFQRHVIGGSVADTQNFLQYAGPQATRDAVMGYLRDKALGGAADEVGKFSQSGFNAGLRNLGNRKLEAIFEPEQLAQLRALGRASSYAQAQPAGSAVNNSNSGALMLGRGADLLSTVAKKIPGGQMFVADPLRSINISLSNRQAQNVLPGLLAQPDQVPMMQRLLGPSIAAGGLLSAPTSP